MEMPARGRTPTYCSTRCRVAAHRARKNADPVPDELRSINRWVRYSRDKVPLTVDGEPASSTDPGTWSSYREAVGSRAGAGVGFVLDGDGIVCIDLDDCLRRDGTPKRWVSELLSRVTPTYVEVSPSGRGLHIWGYATVGRGRKRGAVEVYGRGRYITVTGRPLGGCPSSLADISSLTEPLLKGAR